MRPVIQFLFKKLKGKWGKRIMLAGVILLVLYAGPKQVQEALRLLDLIQESEEVSLMTPPAAPIALVENAEAFVVPSSLSSTRIRLCLSDSLCTALVSSVLHVLITSNWRSNNGHQDVNTRDISELHK